MKEIQEDSTKIKDIMNNSQGMVPLPGTLQAGFEVKVLYDLSNF